MQTQRIPLARVQRAVVLQLLQDDRPMWWTVSELVRALDSPRVESAVGKLVTDDVIEQDGERIRASRSVRHLDTLGLIAV